MASMSVNSQANLASTNFPALDGGDGGGGGGSANNGNPYAAANALGKRNQHRGRVSSSAGPPPSMTSASDFPGLGGSGGGGAHQYGAVQNLHKK